MFLDVVAILLLGILTSRLSASGSSANSGALSTIDPFSNLSTQSLVALTIILFLLKSTFVYALNMTFARFIGNVEARRASLYLRKYLDQGLTVADKFNKAKLPHLLMDSVSAGVGQSLTALSIAFGELVLILSISVVLVLVSPFLFICVGTMFLAAGVSLHFLVNSRITKRASKADDDRVKLLSLIGDIQNNYRVIFAHKKTNEFASTFMNGREIYARTYAEITSLSIMPRYILELALVTGVVVIFSPQLIDLANLDPATLVVFSIGIFRLVASMMPLQNQINLLQKFQKESKLAMEMETEIEKNSEEPSPGNSKSKGIKPSIFMDAAHYVFEDTGKELLSNITMEISFGKMCVIHGPSGAGKSTFVDLILGLRSPTAGKIQFRDSLSKSGLERSQVVTGYVPQRPDLITGTLRQNICLEPRLSQFSESQILEAVKLADLESFIATLPDGLDTFISRSARLSGGQVQRIGLARALLIEPQILIIDEGTNALDSISRQKVLDALFSLRGQMTIIIISHSQHEIDGQDISISIEPNNFSFQM